MKFTRLFASIVLMLVLTALSARTTHAATARHTAKAPAHQINNCGGYNPPPPARPPARPPAGPPANGPTGPYAGPAAIVYQPGVGAYGPVQGSYGGKPGYGQGAGRFGCLLVWTDRQSYGLSFYGPQYAGDPVYACYAVPAPGQVEIDLYHFTSGYGFESYGGYDDGTGGCGFLGNVSLDAGWRALTIKYWDNFGQESDYTTYYYAS